MVLIGGEVPLEEDILRQPAQFVNTWVEWSARNRQQVAQGNFVITSGGSSTIFAVPENEDLYITGYWLSLSTSGATNVSDRVTLAIQLSTSARPMFQVNVKDNQAGDANNTLALPMPFKVQAGDSVLLTVDGNNSKGVGGIVGFTVPKFISGRE